MSARYARTTPWLPVTVTLDLMSNPRVDSEKADPMQAVLVLTGAASAFAGGLLVVLAIAEQIEYPQAFMSVHGGTLQLLVFGVPLLVGGILAIRLASKRARAGGKHDV